MAFFEADRTHEIRKNLYTTIYEDDREGHTNSFWAFECRQMFPERQGFFVGQEIYPDYSNLKIDRVVSELTPHGRLRKVVTGEDKKLGVGPADIAQAENDVETKALLAMNKDRTNAVYCQTTRATTFRTWIIRKPTCRLEPLFGADTRGDPHQYIDICTSFGQYQWHRLGSLVKNEPELDLSHFEFQFDLKANFEWDRKHEKMQLALEEKHSEDMAALLLQQEEFNAASIPQAAEDLELPSAMQADNEGFEEETSEMSETPTFGQEQADDSYHGQSSQTQAQASSSLTIYNEVQLSVERGKKGTYIVFNHEGRSFRTKRDQWTSARDESNRQCYQWYSNSFKLFFRAYQWP
ncbi:hypothetical protein CTAM01_17069 [Colletotrichum tamarilloi]|uniref:Uncharacterized protein n=1 Tax=Colletotrichum tamarilloi TaxID=1209934 RepID=A0ABQ9QGQ2_9PEZI|nr:uncharacterized protein CTAM01_17069 [Colletotrichum tamarilloi]KAK1464375.1 hypothetical protein CTAM01_17069 [Colletotrichum tamarilloi]